MKQQIAYITLLVKDYDEAILFYTDKMNFRLVEDTHLSPTKRWVTISPPGSSTALLLAKAANNEQLLCVGNQCGGRVFLFLHTDNFMRDYQSLKNNNVSIVREATEESWGTVAVLSDLYGNLWDLIEPSKKT